nr:MAG: hypothetical protein [Microvirus sp.]
MVKAINAALNLFGADTAARPTRKAILEGYRLITDCGGSDDYIESNFGFSGCQVSGVPIGDEDYQPGVHVGPNALNIWSWQETGIRGVTGPQPKPVRHWEREPAPQHSVSQETYGGFSPSAIAGPETAFDPMSKPYDSVQGHGVPWWWASAKYRPPSMMRDTAEPSAFDGGGGLKRKFPVPAPKATHESKATMSFAAQVALQTALATTEIIDFADAVQKGGLPPHLRLKYRPGDPITPDEKLANVIANMGSFDLSGALTEVLKNHFEDKVVGGLNRGTGKLREDGHITSTRTPTFKGPDGKKLSVQKGPDGKPVADWQAIATVSRSIYQHGVRSKYVSAPDVNPFNYEGPTRKGR